MSSSNTARGRQAEKDASSDVGASSPTTHGAPSSRTISDAQLLTDDDRAGLRDEWTRVEVRFVDDPAGAVRAADDLIGQVIERIRTALDERRPAARADWTDVEEATTEQLREALHRYEVLFDQLTDAPGPDDWRQNRADTGGRERTTSISTNTTDMEEQG